MRTEYGIFRAFCAVSAIMLCALLITTGILTAKYRTEQTVFGNVADTVRVYEKEDSTVISINGRVTSIEPERLARKADALSHTVFSPLGNVIELAKAVVNAVGSLSG